jgi:uncharacterized membrane protein YhaH (DUF805 family)
MNQSKDPANKKTRRAQRPLWWIAILSIVIGSLLAVISFILLAQPVTEENLWTLSAIPLLIAGGCIAFVGVVVLIVNGALRGTLPEEPGEKG